MRRRDFITLLGGAAVPVAGAARAQQKAMPVIGYLSSQSSEGVAAFLPAFRDGLKQTGYSEGENVAIEFALADGKYDRLPALAAGLVGRNVTVIVAQGGAVAALAAKGATSTIPIVIMIGDDPVKFGLVTSLGRPGGNITGVTLFMGELAPKRLQLLSELIPDGPLAMLSNPNNPNVVSEAAEVEAATRRRGRELRVFNAGSEREIDAAIAEVAQRPGRAMMVGTDPYFATQREQITALAARHAIPAIYFYRGFVAAGGLISYGATISAEYRVAGVSTGRILAGEKPGDLPIVQPSKIELVVNLRAAKALGITVPTPILVRADEVIE
jgi:putative ABC transport system substrate-binding protein